MSACEKCWRDAQARAATTGRSATDHYYMLLEERHDKSCTPEEQRGETQEPIVFRGDKQTMSKTEWVSVKDRLPDFGSAVLVVTADNGARWAGGIGLASRTQNAPPEARPDAFWRLWYLPADDDTTFEGWKPGALYDFEVTHWMPLPDPPKDRVG